MPTRYTITLQAAYAASGAPVVLRATSWTLTESAIAIDTPGGLYVYPLDNIQFAHVQEDK